MRVGLRVRVRVRGPNLQHRGVGDAMTDDLVHLVRVRGTSSVRARLGVRGSVSVRVRVRVRASMKVRVGFTEVQHDLGKPW